MICQNSEDIFNVSSARRCLEEVEGDCKEGEQHFGSASVSCRCAGEERGCCGEVRVCTICAVVTLSGDVGENGGGLFVTRMKWEDRKRGERRRKSATEAEY